MMDNNELQHWGVRGMRWGVRRYQNKDGTLTTAGKKRYNKELAKLKEEKRILDNKQKTQAKIDKLEAMRKEIDERKHPSVAKVKAKSQSTSEQKPKSVKDMSDAELRKIVERLDLEQRYRNHNPQQVSKGKKFVDGTLSKVIIPAFADVGKKALKSALSKAVGLEDDSKGKKKDKKKDDDDD